MQKTYRPTWAEISLGAIRYNYRAIKRIVPQDVKIMAVVKANAYGHGSIEVSRVLVDEAVDYFGVATLDEAMILRHAGIRIPILVLGSVFPHEVCTASENNITLTLCNDELLSFMIKEGVSIKVHVKIDTGMGRIGVWHEDAPDFVRKIKDKGMHIQIEGLYTHFAVAGRDNFFTQYQIDSFNAVFDNLSSRGITIPVRHAANSIAIVDWKNSHFNMVRPGLIVFGMYPKRSFPRLIKLKPAFSLKTKVAFLKQVPPGRSISYGRTYITQVPTTIATLPIGYADGYGRILSGKAEVLIHGRPAPVIGKVTMDQIMVDVGHIRNVKVGDDVVLLGRQGQRVIKIEEMSRLAGTIPYEIVTGVTWRVPRVFIDK
ncbi:MAG: alanine racemase [Candidatus Omnitrophica bacterium]|nr:alanine racemase [Candidatus Omnitrophota bacterium]